MNDLTDAVRAVQAERRWVEIDTLCLNAQAAIGRAADALERVEPQLQEAERLLKRAATGFRTAFEALDALPAVEQTAVWAKLEGRG